MSDDPAAINGLQSSPGGSLGGNGSRLSFRRAPAPVECLPSAEQGLLGNGTAARVVWRGAWTVEHGSDAGPCLQALWRDDGIQLFAGVALLAHGGAFLGTQSSNVGRAIVELQAARRYPPVVFDMLNDLYRAEFSYEKVWLGATAGVKRPVASEWLARR